MTLADNEKEFTYEQAFKYIAEIRAMIMHENDLISQRMGWMFTSQSIFFGVVGFLWEKQHPELIAVVSLVGLLSCISIGHALFGASQAIKKLCNDAKDFQDKYQKFQLPPTIGLRRLSGPQWVSPWKLMPFVLSLAWIVILFLLIHLNAQPAL